MANLKVITFHRYWMQPILSFFWIFISLATCNSQLFEWELQTKNEKNVRKKLESNCKKAKKKRNECEVTETERKEVVWESN